MEFMSRGGRQTPPAPQQAPAAHQPVSHGQVPKRKKLDWSAKTLRYLIFVVLVGCALLLATVSVFLARENGPGLETNQINTTEYQAVFLNNGQIYFGKIGGLNDKAIVLNDVFYLHCNDTSTNCSSQSFTLYKLGVSEQLPGSEDKIVFNHEQISFWENLKNNGKVASAIASYKKNPNSGSGQVQQSGGTSQTPAASTGTGATGAATGTGTKTP